MLTIQDLCLKSVIPIDTLLSMEMHSEINCHANLYFKAIVPQDAVKLIEKGISGTSTILIDLRSGTPVYQGVNIEFILTEQNGLFHLEGKTMGFSYLLDIQEKNRSFQHTDMYYADMLKKLYSDANANINTTSGRFTRIGVPIFQYQETDWKYTLRMAGNLKTHVIPECSSEKPQVRFGISSNQKREISTSEQISGWHDIGFLQEKKRDTQTPSKEFYYQKVSSDEIYQVGDGISSGGVELVVMKATISFINGVYYPKYTLGRARDYMVSYHTNPKQVGLTLEGTVIETDHDCLKIHLDIDKVQNLKEAHFFPYVPELGNVMYTMPKVGTRACIKCEVKADGSWIAINSPRTNSESCSELTEINKRYYTTEFNKQIGMLPDAVYYQGDNNTIKLQDGSGESFSTKGQFFTHAKKGIHLKSKKKVKGCAPAEIMLTKSDTESAIVMSSSEIQLQNDSTNINYRVSSESMPYPEFDSTPAMKMGAEVALKIAGSVPIRTKVGEE